MPHFELFELLTHMLLVTFLGLYLITLLQWYDYKITRVLIRHHKRWWHVVYFAIPFFMYHMVSSEYFWIFFYFAVLPSYVVWYKKLSKPVVFTWRVKRYFMILIGLALFGDFLVQISPDTTTYPLFFPLALAVMGSVGIERFLFLSFKKDAIAKLERMKKMKVIAITGSYGKTSMKNFVVQLLSSKYRVYATPGNVNTLGGVIRDINQDLPNDTEIYVVEAGARERGDIYAIAQLVHPHAVIVGKVGPQHIEYFKTLDNIILTKMELIHSDRLEKAFIHRSVTQEPHDRVSFFGENISNVSSHLNGMSFDLSIGEDNYSFHTKVLGSFQAINIEAAILMAKYFKIDMSHIVEKVAALNPVPHRLEKIDTGAKVILDDSYNGNLEGMLEAIDIASEYEGRKVIVTPGLIESTEDANIQLAQRINEVFDVVIITGTLNSNILDGIIHKPFKLVLKDKSHMEKMLGSVTKDGDLILFANDAPSFI